MAHALLLILHIVAYEIIVPTFCSQLLLLLSSCSVPPQHGLFRCESWGSLLSITGNGSYPRPPRDLALSPLAPCLFFRLLCHQRIKETLQQRSGNYFLWHKNLGHLPKRKEHLYRNIPNPESTSEGPGRQTPRREGGAHLLTSL